MVEAGSPLPVHPVELRSTLRQFGEDASSKPSSSSSLSDAEPVLARCLAPFTRRVHQAVVDQQAGAKAGASGAAGHPNAAGAIDAGNWANLPAGVLEIIFGFVFDGSTKWPQRRNLFAAGGVCTNWRLAAHHVFYGRRATLATITRPEELFITRPYRMSTSLLHTLLVREKSPNGPTQYYLYLGEPEQERHEKLLLAASHHSRFGKHRFVVRLCPEFTPELEEANCVATLKTNILGTSYDLKILWDTALRVITAADPKVSLRQNSGSMVYRRNFFGIRGPRKLAVQLPHIRYMEDFNSDTFRTSFEADNSRHMPIPVLIDDGFLHEPNRGILHRDDSNDDPAPIDGKVVMKNVPPHWHEVLQCWCLNFGGRVKEASVKNFQLMDVREPDRVAMQFGKVAKDRFILDFDPLKISPVQAFAVALSSFESKLPYE